MLKQVGDADFSLMPWLFPRAMRPHVRAFGRFVRLSDRLVDTHDLSQAEKIARLEVMESALEGGDMVAWSDEAAAVMLRFCASLRQTGVSPLHARLLIRAFRRDATGVTYRTWNDLMVYCHGSAAPIGRHLLELMGEDELTCGPPSDAGCAALRILKQLRDCHDHSLALNRLCIPTQFLDDAMVSEAHLRAPFAKGQTRAVIDRVLDGVDALLARAAPLPKLLRSHGLRTHTAIVLCRANKLARRFREEDPLQGRVALDAGDRRLCAWGAVIRSWLRRT